MPLFSGFCDFAQNDGFSILSLREAKRRNNPARNICSFLNSTLPGNAPLALSRNMSAVTSRAFTYPLATRYLGNLEKGLFMRQGAIMIFLALRPAKRGKRGDFTKTLALNHIESRQEKGKGTRHKEILRRADGEIELAETPVS
ncbi:MAG: hypothetical protein LBB65_02385 [Burkholderiales bacterium]|jgi:hypothetical protein|nr:hypothetical protein [Burkholderiales bacterium]